MTVLTGTRRWPLHGLLEPGPKLVLTETVIIGIASAAIGMLTVAPQYQTLLRPIAAALLLLVLLPVTAANPRRGTIITLALLPFLGEFRRMLIPVAGWSKFDPLLLVAPLVTLIAFNTLYLMPRRSLAVDRLSKLILALVGVALIGAINPASGDILSGVIGLLFIVGPLLWFFVGRATATATSMRAVTIIIFTAAIANAIYGLTQTERGFTSWDQAWVDIVRITSYQALSIKGITRAVGTFASSAEYATCLGVALCMAVAMANHKKYRALCLAPLLFWALWLASGRTLVVLSLFAVLVLFAIRARNIRAAVAISVIPTIAIIVLLVAFRGFLNQQTQQETNPLISHQLSGLANPFDPNRSTLFGHWQLVFKGLAQGLKNPIGLGTGAATPAASNVKAAQSTELDLSNMFVSFGLGGGILYLWIFGSSLWMTIRLYFARRDVLVASVLAVLVVSLGQWLNGGYYFIAPMIWYSIGWVCRETATLKNERAAALGEGLVTGTALPR